MAKNESVATCLAAVLDNITVITSCREMIDDIVAEAGQSDVLTELRQAEKIHEALLEELKNAARESKMDRIAVGDAIGDIVVSTTRPQVIKDPTAFFAVAKRNGDYDTLVAAGVVKLDIDAKQIPRLESRLAARYAEFVEEGKGSTRVLLPAALQLKAPKPE